MRVAIIGSRSITDEAYVFGLINRFIKDQCVHPVTILSGGAKGVDKLARKYADDRGHDFIEFIPYHILDKSVEFSNKYYFTRNKQLIMNADKVLAIWDGESTGTQHAIRFCQKLNVPVMVIKST